MRQTDKHYHYIYRQRIHGYVCVWHHIYSEPSMKVDYLTYLTPFKSTLISYGSKLLYELHKLYELYELYELDKLYEL